MVLGGARDTFDTCYATRTCRLDQLTRFDRPSGEDRQSVITKIDADVLLFEFANCTDRGDIDASGHCSKVVLVVLSCHILTFEIRSDFEF